MVGMIVLVICGLFLLALLLYTVVFVGIEFGIFGHCQEVLKELDKGCDEVWDSVREFFRH
jgi:hypothetical protein